MILRKIPFVRIIFILVINYLIYCNGFNLSPKPNIQINEPPYRIEAKTPKNRSSYFGFSINLRKNSIMIGAPRAAPTIESQSTLVEPGAVYKCSLENNECIPFIFEQRGNWNFDDEESGADDFACNKDKRDEQWLGVSMDGGNNENNKFVVCAHRIICTSYLEVYTMHGICYWSENTLVSQPYPVLSIKPLRLKYNQLYKSSETNDTIYWYQFGQQGISVHITDDNDQILIGAPGLFNYKGTLIRNAVTESESGTISKRDVNQQKSHIAREDIVLNPNLWKQPYESYFGYSVSSGAFGFFNKILYVASAPRANDQSGEVYIFEIVNKEKINILHTFKGNQMGDIYGYTILVDDFNNDQRDDIVVAAPFHSSSSNTYDNGVVYVYINDVNSDTLSFLPPIELKSHILINHQLFGMGLGKIGDINLDGYNDLAVGAPYNEGAVYIFLGCAEGIKSSPSQVLWSPNPVNMFGVSISRGSDIDNNGYFDIAVGSPEEEKVYIYKSYPVVEIIPQIELRKKEILITDPSFEFFACWSIFFSGSNQRHDKTEATINIILRVDKILNRAVFSENNINELEFNATATGIKQCKNFEVLVKLAKIDSIYKSIDIEFQYDIIQKVPESNEFCATCLAMDSTSQQLIREKVVFHTGCKNTVCVANLVISNSIDNITPFIVGSSKFQVIDYKVTNIGENGYMPQLRVNISEPLSYMKIPSSCTLENKELKCFFQNSLMANGDEQSMKVYLDTTKLNGYNDRVYITAEVTSSGDESDPDDNFKENILEIYERTEIEISGKSSHPYISLDKVNGPVNVSHTLEFRNLGPSAIRSMEVDLLLPITYLDSIYMKKIDFIETNNISISAEYNNVPIELSVDIELENGTTVLLNQHSNVMGPLDVPDSLHGLNYDASKIGFELDYGGSVISETESVDESSNYGLGRKRRNDFGLNRNDKSLGSTAIITIRENRREITNIPKDRVVLMNCSSTEVEQNVFVCIGARFTARNLPVNGDPIKVNINMTLYASEIEKIMTDQQHAVIVQVGPIISSLSEGIRQELVMIYSQPFTFVSRHSEGSIPLWVYIVSPIVGILLLIMMIYLMYRYGFFNREKKEELQKLTRESQPIAPSNNGNSTDEE